MLVLAIVAALLFTIGAAIEIRNANRFACECAKSRAEEEARVRAERALLRTWKRRDAIYAMTGDMGAANQYCGR